MEPLNKVHGIVLPIDRANVDTDAIIPKQYLKSIYKSGFGENLFDAWRYLDSGEPGQDNSKRDINPDFVLNKKRYQGAEILLARENFGCGSSREHAVWALRDYGIRVVIAPSFGDIFRNNCFKNGTLPVKLPGADVDKLFTLVEANPGYDLEINLEEQTVATPEGKVYRFEIDSFNKNRLINGLDDIDMTLMHAEEIKKYEDSTRSERPWLFED